MRRYCLALDLIDDKALIEEYERFHKPEHVWPEIKSSITQAGIVGLEIYRIGTRLFMIMETEDDFSFEKKSEADANNPKVIEWEQLMWKFQQPTPWSKPGEKWSPLSLIFKL
jgi:L-rhamnose mutarotase